MHHQLHSKRPKDSQFLQILFDHQKSLEEAVLDRILAGRILAAAGRILAAAGRILAAAGRILAAAGRILAAAGRILVEQEIVPKLGLRWSA